MAEIIDIGNATRWWFDRLPIGYILVDRSTKRLYIVFDTGDTRLPSERAFGKILGFKCGSDFWAVKFTAFTTFVDRQSDLGVTSISTAAVYDVQNEGELLDVSIFDLSKLVIQYELRGEKLLYVYRRKF